MAYLHKKYYYRNEDIPIEMLSLIQGFDILEKNPLFCQLKGEIYPRTSHLKGKDSIACVTRNGDVFVNIGAGLEADEWAYVLAHNLLHLAFGHFDRDKIPQTEEYYPSIWNKACDIYVARFLEDIGFGYSLFPDPASAYPVKQNNEVKIYEYILSKESREPKQTYGLNTENANDMIGLGNPIIYKSNEHNDYAECFAYAITHAIKNAVSDAGGHAWDENKDTVIAKAASWFLAHYPLLGGLAASFRIIEDTDICHKYEIHIAAVDAVHGEIYANPNCGLSEEEWKFVLAHEFLHAGLCHHQRCMGREQYLWNVACDYVINDWLREMRIGEMPAEGLLYDETLHGMSAEAIYDKIVKEMRKFKKHATFRGFNKGDIFWDAYPHFKGMVKGISLDDFFKNALLEGLDYHVTQSRGYIPAGLVEEIRALSMPPIPWEVKLAEWFDVQFPPLEKHRTYARPSRRQSATPDIPKPSYLLQEKDMESRTFGVIIDTSGSVSSKQIGLALGAVASYAVSKEVPFVRIIFCDADATDAGYMAPEDIAGRVEVTGRGGTILQEGVNALERAKDFPAKGPILIITDGWIEENLRVKREHAFLIPKGNKLPFNPKGKIFFFQ